MTDPLITDGRTARRERNRNAVLDAVLELFGEGSTNPTPDEVATRSGVSLRSVYRYFDDRESLLRSAMEHHFRRLQPLFALTIDLEEPLERRVDSLVRQRLHLYESAAPVFRAAIARAGANPLIEQRVRDRRTMLARQAEQMFAPELAELGNQAEAASAMVDAVTEFETFDHLVRFRGLARDDAATAVARTLHQILQRG